MDRRHFLLTSLAGALAAPLAAEGQQTGKMWRLGFLTEGLSSDGGPDVPLAVFFSELRELGYIDGQNLTVLYRFAEGQAERLPELAAELVRSKVDLIAASGTREVLALKAATASIPIVMLFPGDPVGAGIVQSLTSPGANITGTSLTIPDLGAKRVQVLWEIVPTLQRVAILGNPSNASTAAERRSTEAAVRSLGVSVQPVGIESPGQLDASLRLVLKARPHAILLLQDAVTFARRREIADFALDKQLPIGAPARGYALAGALFSYGVDLRAITRRAATYVDRILKGARPGDLPIEQPTKFELVINMKTAKALGLTMPPSLLQRADHVIE